MKNGRFLPHHPRINPNILPLKVESKRSNHKPFFDDIFHQPLVLDTIGSAAEAYQHARYEEMNRFSDCFHSSSGMHCPPVDGWAEYYPIPNGTWYIEVGFGPVAFDSRKNIEVGAGLVVCAGLCVGGEANIEIPLEDFAQSEHDLKFTRGMGFGSDVSIGNSNRYGYLIMIGHSSSSNGGNENFFRATAVDVSIEIGYEYE